MKKCLITIIGVIFFAFPAYGAGLELSETSIKFGNVKEGPPVEKTVTLTNTGSDVINIKNTSTSCACTSVKLSDTSINPGETAELLITYKTFKYPGKFDKTITIFTGPEGKEETVIHILGNVDPMPMGVIAMKPRKTDVGELTADTENRVSIVIINEGDAPLTVSRIYSGKFETEYYNAGNSEGIEIAAGRQVIVGFAVTPQKQGRFLDSVMIFSDARNDIGKGYKGLLSGTVK